jgi:hypothetical protein
MVLREQPILAAAAAGVGKGKQEELGVRELHFYLSQLQNTPAQRQAHQQLQLAVQTQY